MLILCNKSIEQILKTTDMSPVMMFTQMQCWAQIRYSLPVTVTSYKLLTQSYWQTSLGKLHVTHKLLLKESPSLLQSNQLQSVPSKLLISSYFWAKTFFLAKFLRVTQFFFRYWNLYSNDLGIGQSHFGLGQCLGLKTLFFRRVTKLGGRHIISSHSIVFTVTMMTRIRGCKCDHCFCDGKILWTFTKPMTPSMGL